MNWLDSIGLAYGTDKASSHHDYLRVYEQQIPHTGKGSLLELGWLDGASIGMWREWLPATWTVTGLDIEPKTPLLGTNFVLGSQDDPQTIAVAAGSYGPFDVIIDDASHESHRTIASISLLWEHLKPGGRYFIEDLQTSYLPAWNGQGNTIMWFLKHRADDVHIKHGRRFDVQHIAFWRDLAMLQKES